MRTFVLALAAGSMLLFVPPAWAAPEKFVWDGYGTSGGSKCPTYKMHIEFVVENGAATGHWQQQGRTVREFSLPIDGAGNFTGEVVVGGGGKMSVRGNVGPGPAIELTGYCNFGGNLKRE